MLFSKIFSGTSSRLRSTVPGYPFSFHVNLLLNMNSELRTVEYCLLPLSCWHKYVWRIPLQNHCQRLPLSCQLRCHQLLWTQEKCRSYSFYSFKQAPPSSNGYWMENTWDAGCPTSHMSPGCCWRISSICFSSFVPFPRTPQAYPSHLEERFEQKMNKPSKRNHSIYIYIYIREELLNFVPQTHQPPEATWVPPRPALVGAALGRSVQ